MESKIVKLIDVDQSIYVEQIKEIFFLSSSVQSFSSNEKREQFYHTWCGDYVRLWPHRFYLYMREDKLCAYLATCFDSTSAQSDLRIPGYDLFSDLFHDYNAHLHINAHPERRGGGIGSTLINALIEDLKCEKIGGVHLITAPDARNVSFYHKNGFNFEERRSFKGNNLLFLGRQIDS